MKSNVKRATYAIAAIAIILVLAGRPLGAIFLVAGAYTAAQVLRSRGRL